MRISKEMIEDPNEQDILFGRDSDSWNHEGNRRFRSVVAKYQSKYHATKSRAEKVTIVATIVAELKSSGTRFLKRDHPNKKWYEVDRKACIEKVGHAIRDKMAIAQRRQMKKTQDARRESSPRSSIGGLSSGLGQDRTLAGLESLCGDTGDLAIRNPALFESMIARRLLAGDSNSFSLVHAMKARNAQNQAFDMASQKLAAVDSMITALKEQEQAKKEIVACRQRRSILAAMLAEKTESNENLMSLSDLAGLPLFQTARRHSAMVTSNSHNNSLVRHRQPSILDSVLQYRRSSAPAGSLAIPSSLVSQFT